MANLNGQIEQKRLEIEQKKDERSGYAQFLPVMAIMFSVFALFTSLTSQDTTIYLAQLASFLSLVFSIIVYIRYRQLTDGINVKYGELQKLVGSNGKAKD